MFFSSTSSSWTSSSSSTGEDGCSNTTTTNQSCTIVDGQRKCENVERFFRKCPGMPLQERQKDGSWAVARDGADGLAGTSPTSLFDLLVHPPTPPQPRRSAWADQEEGDGNPSGAQPVGGGSESFEDRYRRRFGRGGRGLAHGGAGYHGGADVGGEEGSEGGDDGGMPSGWAAGGGGGGGGAGGAGGWHWPWRRQGRHLQYDGEYETPAWPGWGGIGGAPRAPPGYVTNVPPVIDQSMQEAMRLMEEIEREFFGRRGLGGMFGGFGRRGGRDDEGGY